MGRTRFLKHLMPLLLMGSDLQKLIVINLFDRILPFVPPESKVTEKMRFVCAKIEDIVNLTVN